MTLAAATPATVARRTPRLPGPDVTRAIALAQSDAAHGLPGFGAPA